MTAPSHRFSTATSLRTLLRNCVRKNRSILIYIYICIYTLYSFTPLTLLPSFVSTLYRAPRHSLSYHHREPEKGALLQAAKRNDARIALTLIELFTQRVFEPRRELFTLLSPTVFPRSPTTKWERGNAMMRRAWPSSSLLMV